MKTQNYRYLLCMAVALLAACSDAGKGKESEEGVATVLPSESNEVTVKVLKRATFEHELVSNGKVTAGAMADLRFETTGVVAHIYVKNGDPVRKGQKLAELDKFRLKNKTAQAKDALDKAELELQDVLIGQGYPVGDTSKIPADIMKLARVKSGYDQSLSQYELAAYEEEHATLVAPFDGVVANLFSKPFNEASTSESFCSIIGTQSMEVDFTVLESELPLIKSGDKVIVTPYSDAGFRQEGRITQINPRFNNAVIFAFDLVHQLHCFHNAKDLTFAYFISYFYKGGIFRRRCCIIGTYKRRFYHTSCLYFIVNSIDGFYMYSLLHYRLILLSICRISIDCHLLYNCFLF